MQQKFAAVPVGGWPVWGAAEMSCLPKKVLSVPCVFFFFFTFFFDEHASLHLLVWHAKDFWKSLRSGLSQRQLSSTIVVLARALHLHFSSLHHGFNRSRKDKPGQITEEETAGLA